MSRVRVAWPLLAATVAFTAWLAWAARGETGRRVWGHVPASWLRGLELLHEGAAADAAQAFAAAEQQLGEAPLPLLRARLHASLLAGQLREAAFTVEKLAVAGEPPALVEFVHGLVEHGRCARAAFEAEQPGGDPTALDRAILHARRAAAAFQRASLGRDVSADWPAARRNAERALVRLAALQREKTRREQQKRPPEEQPPPPEPPEVDPLQQELRLDDEARLLTAAELQALLERLAEAEREKRAIRREAQRSRAGVEQDW